MRTDIPQAVKLDDYTPYPFDIEKVDLSFDLDPSKTTVEAKLRISRKQGSSGQALELDGEKIILRSLRIDGRDLPESSYTVSDTKLTIQDVPETFDLETCVEISPEANTALSGLYMSGGRFCTQCEATGFRRITYWPDRPDVMSRFTVSITADEAAYPILLSNGSPLSVESDGKGRHKARWDDPHKKPSYLFALCAGDYDLHKDEFTTISGRRVDLTVYVDKGEADKAVWAMDCLKRSMAWDEQVFGREYDLDVFNIVAVRDFNSGAMENKGLNIFNSAYVLADEASATDSDFEAIESIVAHEYFHNWTGNRITCRDWFQLCLKEGLTVFRDQEFSADMRSRPVQRIKDVIRLRARQFPEDAGPLAHAVRPSVYGAIDNLYTATVYEKGAELIRMLKGLVGPKTFADGINLYFDRHDGNAATIEDFYACFEEASGQDLSNFRRWYAQPGTPTVNVEEEWNPATQTLTIHLEQHNPDVSDFKDRQPLPIPLKISVFSPGGSKLKDDLVLLDKSQLTISIKSQDGRPYLSINRGFSAPVHVDHRVSREIKQQAISLEDDPFNQWNTLQALIQADLLLVANGDENAPDSHLITMIADTSRRASEDPAFAALLLRLPDIGELMGVQTPANPATLGRARQDMKCALAEALSDDIINRLKAPEPKPFRPNAEQAGERALRAGFMDLAAYSPTVSELLPDLFSKATSMTEQLAALTALVRSPLDSDDALEAFSNRWQKNPLVMDKWFRIQAQSGSVDAVRGLTHHQDFDFGNPNRVRAVVGTFAMHNLEAFHAADGSGYRFLAEMILTIDPKNPALAARLAMGFEQWRRVDQTRQAQAKQVLSRLVSVSLSQTAHDIIARTIG